MNKTVYLTQDQRDRLMALLICTMGTDLEPLGPVNRIATIDMALQERYSVEYDEHVEYVLISQGRPLNYFGAIIGTDENINWLLLHI